MRTTYSARRNISRGWLLGSGYTDENLTDASKLPFCVRLVRLYERIFECSGSFIAAAIFDNVVDFLVKRKQELLEISRQAVARR